MKHVEDAMPPEPAKKQKKRQPVGNESDEHYLKISEPMLLTNYFVDKPKQWLGICLLIIVITIGIDLSLDYFKESKTTNRDYLIWDDITTIQYDKTNLA
jgi:hypothetical protein